MRYEYVILNKNGDVMKRFDDAVVAVDVFNERNPNYVVLECRICIRRVLSEREVDSKGNAKIDNYGG